VTKEKKQQVAVGVLALAVVSVGAFQFKSLNSAPEAPEAVELSASAEAKSNDKDLLALTQHKNPTVEEKDDELRKQLTKILVANTRPRDPFTPANAEDFIDDAKVITPPSPGNTGSSSPQIPPLNPIPGVLGGSTTVFNPDTGEGISNLANVQPAQPEYRLKGVMLGTKKLAVFEDASGNQRVVPLGGSLDSETKVVAIEDGKVKLESQNQAKILGLEKDAN
jgi:hypothetical protein